MSAIPWADQELAPPTLGGDVGDGPLVAYRRSPQDLLRLAVFAVVLTLAVVLARYGEDAVVGFEEDLISLLARVPVGLERLLVGAMQLTAVGMALVVIVAVPVETRQPRLSLAAGAAAVAADVVMRGLLLIVERPDPSTVTSRVAERAGIASHNFPSAPTLGALTAAFVVAGPFVSRRWRRAGAVGLATLMTTRLLVAVTRPGDLFVALAAGGVVGAGALLAFGRPDRRPTRTALIDALGRGGLPMISLRPAGVDARGSTPYFGSLADGGPLFVKVLGREERSADLLFRLLRFLRLKHVGDERPFSSLRRAVEHEALVALHARDLGVRTPRLRGVVAIDDDNLLLAYDQIAGRSLDRVADEELTDDALRQIWSQVNILLRGRVAHRDLRLANIFLDDAGTSWLIDFGFSEIAAPDLLLHADVAELLTSMTLKVGPERAAQAAVSVLGPDAVAAAMPRLQLNALSGATRHAIKARPGLLGELRRTVSQQTATPEPQLERLERVNKRTILTVAMLAAVVHFLLPQIGDVGKMGEKVRDADWTWLPLIVGASALSYLGAALSMAGAVPNRLRFLPNLLAQMASSFVNRVSPANVGGMALNTRFLQRSGVDAGTAVTGVGLNTLGGLVVHVALTALFVVWAGNSAFSSVKLPSPEKLLVGGAVVAVLAVAALLIPAVRQKVRRAVGGFLARSLTGVRQVLRRPGKLVLLVGGSAIVSLSYVASLYFSSRAFAGGLSVATVGAVYLAGSAIASAAPTPGGLGAVEAALIAGLTAAGMPSEEAVPTVFLFRLGTFWLPVLPGGACFMYLKRADYL